MKVIELKSENFKRLTATVQLDGKSVTVTGKNGSGKSTFIDAVWLALTGEMAPKQPIKEGEEKASIELTVRSDDGAEFIVEKRFTKAGSSLAVRTKDGAKYPSPQKFLDEKIGNISFDPFEFLDLKPLEQKRWLMSYLGIDLTSIENRKQTLLNEKNALVKEYVAKEQEIKNLPVVPEGLEYIDPSTVLQEMKEAQSLKDLRIEAERGLEGVKSDARKCSGYLTQTRARIEDLEKQLQQELERQEILSNEMKAIDKAIKTAEEAFNKIAIPEEVDFASKLSQINANNILFDNKAKKDQALTQLSEIKAQGDAKNNEIKKVEQERLDAIASANIPVPGLSFGEEGLTFEGLPFQKEQLSTAKLIEIGVRIQMSLNPKLRIMKVKDGSLLDSDALDVIRAITNQHDFQLFVEKVSDDKEVGFIID